MNTKKSTGNKAVGAYLRRLREIRGYTRTKVAATLDTNENQIKRIEDAVGSTSGLTLLKLIRLLNGSAEQVADLVVNDEATEEDGRRLAEDWAQQGEKNCGLDDSMAFYVEVTKAQRNAGFPADSPSLMNKLPYL